MALEFTIEISDQDLPFFMQALERAEQRASGKSAQQILDAARKTLSDSHGQSMPEFVRSRVASVDNLMAMVSDEGWALADEDRSRIISALTYFADPEDLIPDNVPVLGFLDDAIMIEVVGRVLAPEIEAYADFCAYRSQEAARRGEGDDERKLGRAEWLEGRRAELQARMRVRRSSYAPTQNWTPRFSFR
ncbi:MAG TPA: YkvA family protein [Rudaea sp.]|nr:YkvA family protein [Rudaea sp.]